MNSRNEWPMVKLGEIQRKVSSINPAKSPDQEFVLYSVPAYDIGTPEKTLGNSIKSNKIELEPSDVLLSKIVPHIRRSWLVGEHETPSIGSSEWIVYRDRRFDPRYLRNFFHSDYFHAQFMQTVAGVGGSLNRARPAAVAQISIPLPPLAEQQRIAEILDETSSSLTFAKRKAEKIEASRPALFDALFPSENYDLTTIDNFLSETQYGSSKKAGEVGKYPILRMGNLTNSGSISYANMKYLDLEKKEVNKYTLRDGDILFNRTNSKELVGKTAVYYGKDDQVAYAGYLIRGRANDQATPEFIAGFLNSRYGKAQLFQRAKAIVGMANINAKELRTLVIPAVPLEDQKRYSLVYQELEDLRQVMEIKIEKLEELHRSLSTRAFSGQL